jgi:hypothetical protein
MGGGGTTMEECISCGRSKWAWTDFHGAIRIELHTIGSSGSRCSHGDGTLKEIIACVEDLKGKVEG